MIRHVTFGYLISWWALVSVMVQICGFLWTRKVQKGFSFRGLRPLTNTGGSAPWTSALCYSWCYSMFNVTKKSSHWHWLALLVKAPTCTVASTVTYSRLEMLGTGIFHWTPDPRYKLRARHGLRTLPRAPRSLRPALAAYVVISST